VQFFFHQSEIHCCTCLIKITISKCWGDNELLIPSARKVAIRKSRRALATPAQSK